MRKVVAWKDEWDNFSTFPCGEQSSLLWIRARMVREEKVLYFYFFLLVCYRLTQK